MNLADIIARGPWSFRQYSPLGDRLTRASCKFMAVALIAMTGCSTMKPSWLPGATSSPPDALGQKTVKVPSATATSQAPMSQAPVSQAPMTQAGERHDIPKPEVPENLSKDEKKALAEYYTDLAKGIDLEQGRKYPQARVLFEQLVGKYPNRYEAYQRLAHICDRQKRYTEAQELYSQAIQLQGKEPDTDLFNDLGYSFFLQGKLDKAESAMLKAVALRPKEPKYHNNLGLVYGHQKRFDQAWEEFRRAGGEADAFYNLAFVKASLNDFEGAKASFRRALAIDPAHERARRALRAFEVAESDPDSLTQIDTDSDGTSWVPYVEPGQAAANAVAAASKEASDKPTPFVVPSRNLHGGLKSTAPGS